MAAIVSPLGSAAIWVGFRPGSTASGAGSAAKQDHWDAGALMRPDLSSPLGTVGAMRTLAQMAFQAFYDQVRTRLAPGAPGEGTARAVPAARRGGGGRRAALVVRRPAGDRRGRGDRGAVRSGVVVGLAAPVCAAPPHHLDRQLGLGRPGSGCRWHAGGRLACTPAASALLPGGTCGGSGGHPASNYDRMLLDWLAWAAYMAQCAATAGGLIAQRRTHAAVPRARHLMCADLHPKFNKVCMIWLISTGPFSAKSIGWLVIKI